MQKLSEKLSLVSHTSAVLYKYSNATFAIYICFIVTSVHHESSTCDYSRRSRGHFLKCALTVLSTHSVLHSLSSAPLPLGLYFLLNSECIQVAVSRVTSLIISPPQVDSSVSLCRNNAGHSRRHRGVQDRYIHITYPPEGACVRICEIL